MSESLARVVGANCRRIRTGLGMTQDDLARYTRYLGLRWTASKVGDFEAGRYAPTFATLLIVLLALNLGAEDSPDEGGDTFPGGVTLADLLAGNGLISLTDALDVPGGQLADACRGERLTLTGPGPRGQVRDGKYSLSLRRPGPPRPDEIQAAAKGLAKLAKDMQPFIDGVAGVLQRSGLTERRLAKQLGMSDTDLATASFLEWKSTFSEERDRRAGPDANQQKRGRISRELRAELGKEHGR
ncbi:helix-turn-helix transcriptional regulator [Mycobacterium alsense]|uniref:Helix-turn-helix transcriptional regulator n=1 Tax=Mycobacterium alsense TaxID=324058 RepID=A0AA41XVI7_9MYCO|nr:helix-turn-helix transcriptional regulator [Mycobacterium alsense]MCV7381570.1 helix-turn-helix transcriptional regulator [Mycobacterium alsense]